MTDTRLYVTVGWVVVVGRSAGWAVRHVMGGGGEGVGGKWKEEGVICKDWWGGKLRGFGRRK